MLSKPSAPRAQLYGRVSLSVSPFSSLFPRHPALLLTHSASFLDNFPALSNLLMSPNHVFTLSDSTESLEQPRRHINAAS